MNLLPSHDGYGALLAELEYGAFFGATKHALHPRWDESRHMDHFRWFFDTNISNRNMDLQRSWAHLITKLDSYGERLYSEIEYEEWYNKIKVIKIAWISA